MTAAVDEQMTVTVRGACPHDCPDTCAVLVSVRGHATVNAVSPFVFADLGNAPTFSDTKVEIEPAEPAAGHR